MYTRSTAQRNGQLNALQRTIRVARTLPSRRSRQGTGTRQLRFDGQLLHPGADADFLAGFRVVLLHRECNRLGYGERGRHLLHDQRRDAHDEFDAMRESMRAECLNNDHHQGDHIQQKVTCTAASELPRTPVSAANPVFTPAAGTFYAPVTVTMTDATPGVLIYYSTTGFPTTSSPSCASPCQLTISTTTTLRAMATGNGIRRAAPPSAFTRLSERAGIQSRLGHICQLGQYHHDRYDSGCADLYSLTGFPTTSSPSCQARA